MDTSRARIGASVSAQALHEPARRCATALALAAAVGIAVEWRREAAWTSHAEAARRHVASPPVSLLTPSTDARATRPRYRHSVILGGAYNRDEVLRMVREDAVVAAHYRDIALDRLRAEVVSTPRLAYVSYRVGHRVYWTRQPLALAVGEVLLSDGVREVRARCGNRVSDTPQQPTSDVEPASDELDERRAPGVESAVVENGRVVLPGPAAITEQAQVAPATTVVTGQPATGVVADADAVGVWPWAWPPMLGGLVVFTPPAGGDTPPSTSGPGEPGPGPVDPGVPPPGPGDGPSGGEPNPTPTPTPGPPVVIGTPGPGGDPAPSVPEPAVLGLAGLAAVGWYQRRRRQRFS